MAPFQNFWTLLVGLAVACRSESLARRNRPSWANAFPNLPLPPKPELVSQTGSADALQLTLRSPSEMDQILNYYRSILGYRKLASGE